MYGHDIVDSGIANVLIADPHLFPRVYQFNPPSDDPINMALGVIVGWWPSSLN